APFRRAAPAYSAEPSISLEVHVGPGRVPQRRILLVSDRRWSFSRSSPMGHPARPLLPPGFAVLLCCGLPGVRVGDELVVGPISRVLARRVDDAGDMSGAGKHEVNPSTPKLRRLERRAPGSDVVLDRSEDEDVLLGARQSQLLAANHHLPAGKL